MVKMWSWFESSFVPKFKKTELYLLQGHYSKFLIFIPNKYLYLIIDKRMGFWGSLWNGITSVAKAVYNNVVAPVAKAVAYVATPIINTVAKVVKPIINVATKVCEKVSEVITKGKELISKGIDYISNETWLGKKIKEGYNYVMNDTFIGKGIKMVGNAIQKTSNAFFNDTWIGQKLSAAKKWFDNTSVGRLVNAAAPIINLAGTFIGGAGGFIGSAFSITSKVVNVIRNPAQILNIPFVSNTITKIKNSGVYQTFSSLYKKGLQIYQDNIKPTFQKMTTFANSTVSKITNSRLYKLASDYVEKKTPSFVYQATNKINDSVQYVKKKVNSLSQPYVKAFENTSFGNKMFKTVNFVGKYVFPPAKFVTSQTLGRATSYLMDKVKGTDTYKNLVTKNIDRFNYAYTKGFMQANKIANSIKLPESKSNGLDSEPMIASYIQKYGSSSLEAGLNKAVHKFKPISQQKTREAPSLNEVLAAPEKVKFKSVQFTSGQPQEKGYSIEGKMILENKSQEAVKFQIDSGQLFGCSKYKTSQHVVVRKLVGQLQPKQEKQFILQGFCADVGLKWPRKDTNYSLTSYVLDQFQENMNQQEIWERTN